MLLTPVVLSMAVQLDLPPMPFALLTVWLANTASLLLPVSNLTNLLALDRLDLTPHEFAARMWLPDGRRGGRSPCCCVGLRYRRLLRVRYAGAPPPDRSATRCCWWRRRRRASGWCRRCCSAATRRWW